MLFHCGPPSGRCTTESGVAFKLGRLNCSSYASESNGAVRTLRSTQPGRRTLLLERSSGLMNRVDCGVSILRARFRECELNLYHEVEFVQNPRSAASMRSLA